MNTPSGKNYWASNPMHSRRAFVQAMGTVGVGVGLMQALAACGSGSASSGGSVGYSPSGDLLSQAKAEGKVLYYATSDDTKALFGDSFGKAYSWADVTTFVGDASTELSKLTTEALTNSRTADVVVHSPGQRGVYITNELIAPTAGLPNYSKLPKNVVDSTSYDCPVYQSPVVMIYNTTLVTQGPSNLLDLAKPEWKGKIAMAQPQNLSASGTLLASHKSVWGDAQWTQWLHGLKANDVFVTADDTSAYNAVLTGERALCIDLVGDALAAPDNAPVKAQFYDGVALYIVSLSRTKHGTNPYMAALLMNNALTDEVQLAVSKSGRIPITNIDVPNSIDKIVPGGQSSLLPTSAMEKFLDDPTPVVNVFEELWPS